MRLQETFNRLQIVRPGARTQTAASWEQLRSSLTKVTLRDGTKLNFSAFEGPSWQSALAKAVHNTGPSTDYGLTEGEAAAVLLYTAETVVCPASALPFASKDGKGGTMYLLVNDALRSRGPKPYMVFIATLVSALRKLRDPAKPVEPVACVRRWTDHTPRPTDNHYVACGFLSATCNMGVKPNTVNSQSSITILPYMRRAAVVPGCLSLHPNESEVIFEPGTAFRRITPGIYEELPPADAVPTCMPEIRFEPLDRTQLKRENKQPKQEDKRQKQEDTQPKQDDTQQKQEDKQQKQEDTEEKQEDTREGATLVPAQQTQLLFPRGTVFTPLESEDVSGDPPESAHH